MHMLHTLLLRLLVLQNSFIFYMSNPCNCIQYARQSFIFFFSNCFQCRIFCYAADKYYFVILHDYFLQFPHGLIPAESQKMRKRKKSSCGNKMVLSGSNTEPHEHNNQRRALTTTPCQLHNITTLTCTCHPYLESWILGPSTDITCEPKYSRFKIGVLCTC
jgi:hypothetical protein